MSGAAAPAAESGERLPAMWQEIVNSAVQVRGQALQDVLEVGMRVVAAQACRLHQAHHDGGALTSQFAAGEQPGAAFMLLCS